MKKIFFISLLALVCAVGAHATVTRAAYDLSGWAWSSNTGWLSFSSANTGAGGPISGLVAKYTFNNATAADSGGSGYNGTLYGNPAFTPGIAGAQALVLDGVDDYVLTTFTSALTDFTVCTWFKDDGVVNGHNERILDKNYSSGMWLGRNANIPNSWGGGVRESGAPYGIFITLSDNAWHQLCSVRSGTTHYIYGDGASVSTSNTVSSAAISTTALAIGASYAGSSRSGSQVDDVVIYNRALTVSEIQQLYQQNVGSSYGVQAATSTSQAVALFSGYAWSPNVGWVSFNASDVTGCPTGEAQYDKPSAQGGVGANLPPSVSNICTPRVDLFAGKVSGWARILSMVAEDSTSGWLHLSGTNHPSGSGGITYNPSSGAFSGYAWEPSAIGWTNFNASAGGTGVVLCVTGTSNCPPVNPGGVSVSCTASPVNPVQPGTVVTFTANVTGGAGPYTYKWNGVTAANTTSSSYTQNGFGPTLSVSDSAGHTSTTITCPNVVVTGQPGPTSGLKLMIARNSEFPSTSDYTDTTNYSDAYKSLRVVSGQTFKLQWNIDDSVINTAAGYESCDPVVYPLNGPSTNWGGFTSGVQANMETSGVASGEYLFTLTCRGDSVASKMSSTKLNIVSSSLEEL